MAERKRIRMTAGWALTALFLLCCFFPRHWAVGIYFVVLLPLIVINAFLDYRRKGDVTPSSILKITPKLN